MVMPIKWSEEAGRVKLGLPGDFDLTVATALVDSLRHGFAVGDSVEVRADVVERVSVACVQALVAASQHATTSGQRFSVTQPSPALTEACQDLGLAGWLKKWSKA